MVVLEDPTKIAEIENTTRWCLKAPTKIAVVENTILCLMVMSEGLDKICHDRQVIACGIVMLEDTDKYFLDRVAEHFKWWC